MLALLEVIAIIASQRPARERARRDRPML